MLWRTLLLSGWLAALAMPSSADPDVPEKFRLAQVQRGDFLRVLQLEGTLRPEQVASLGSRIAGTVMQIQVREGELVRKGGLLVQFDARQQELGMDLARLQVLKARAELESSDAQRKLAEVNYDRLRRLYETKAASELEVAQGRSQVEAARTRGEEVRAELQITEVALRKAQLDIEATRLLAPFDGVVLEVRASPGELVGPGDRVVLLASSPETLVFRAVVDLRDVNELKVGLPLTVAKAATKVERIVPLYRGGDELSRQALEARVDNARRDLAPFQRATAEVALGKLEGVLQVPRAALAWRPLPEEVDPAVREAYREFKYHQGPDSPTLVVLWLKGRLRPVKVEILATSGDMAAIKGPVKEGDTIIVGRAGLE